MNGLIHLLAVLASARVGLAAEFDIDGDTHLLVGCPAGEAVGVFRRGANGLEHVTTVPTEVDYEFSEKDADLVTQVVRRLNTEAMRRAA